MNFDLTRFRLYIPTLIISLILLWIPRFLFIFAMNIIKFKSFSQCDTFVIKWIQLLAWRTFYLSFSQRYLWLMQSGASRYDIHYLLPEHNMACHSNNRISSLLPQDKPEKFIQSIALGVLEQSSILLNLIIIATGQETMLQLLQWRCIDKLDHLTFWILICWHLQASSLQASNQL